MKKTFYSTWDLLIETIGNFSNIIDKYIFEKYLFYIYICENMYFSNIYSNIYIFENMGANKIL